MSPDLIPFLFCTALCLLPICLGTGSFIIWRRFANRQPVLEVWTKPDRDGVLHTYRQLVVISRAEKKLLEKPEEVKK